MDVLMRQTATGFSSIVVGRRIPATKMLSSGFCDQAHLHNYNSNSMGMTTRISGKQDNNAPKKKLKEKKKQLKLVKGLSRDLYTFSQMGFGLDSDGLKASELVQEQLEKLKAEQKELKKKMKQEEARLKVHNRETASSSSESSDSDCGGEIIDMINSLKKTKTKSCSGDNTMPVSDSNYGNQIQGPGTNTENVNGLKKIEVCMGGKCKKAGGSALLEKLKRVIGIEGAVSECKCMGKCRDGPNLKVSTSNHQFDGDSVLTLSNSMCIGVDLEDVDIIVSNVLAENRNQLGYATAS